MARSDGSAENKVYKGVISLIMDGTIAPGGKLVEQQIADTLKVSRTPVRNAIRTLASEGLIEESGGAGYSLFTLSRKDLKDLYRVKFIVEPQIAKDAAKTAPDSKKGYFDGLMLLEREYYFKGLENLYEINKSIHYGIAELTDNKHMLALQKKLFWRAEIYILFFDTFYKTLPGRTLLRNPDDSVSHRTHKDMIEAIFEHDGAKAEDACRRHLLSTWAMLLRNMEALKGGYGKILISDWDVELPEKP